MGSRSRNQGQNREILSGSPSYTPWRPGAPQTHLVLLPLMGVGMDAISLYRGGKLRHRTVRYPKSHRGRWAPASSQTHRQEAAALALATGTCDLQRLDQYLASTSLPRLLTTGSLHARHCPAILQSSAQPLPLPGSCHGLSSRSKSRLGSTSGI